MDYADDVTLFRFFHSSKMKQNSIYHANFSEYASFIRICFKVMEIWDPKRAIEMYDGRMKPARMWTKFRSKNFFLGVILSLYIADFA